MMYTLTFMRKKYGVFSTIIKKKIASDLASASMSFKAHFNFHF